MISFDLKCAHDHVFEAWFRSSVDYETQSAHGQIVCPICGDGSIAKAVMAPAVAAKGNRRAVPVKTAGASQPLLEPEKLKAMLASIAQAQAEQLKQSHWVGGAFAERARAMHYGEAEPAPIHGTTDIEEARAMLEEGIAVAPLLAPVTPPEQMN